jgi:hypothetical protein
LTLNSYLYDRPSATERLIWGEKPSRKEHKVRAAENIAAFERNFGGAVRRG